MHAKSVELEQNKPTKPSAGITATIGAAAVGAAAVVGGGVASVVHHLLLEVLNQATLDQEMTPLNVLLRKKLSLIMT